MPFFTQAVNAACPGIDGSSSPVVYEGCTEVKDTNGNNTVSISSPATTQVGDYLVLAVAHNRAPRSIILPAGWTTIDVGANTGSNSNDVTFGVYSLFATSAGAQNYNITLGNNDGNDHVYAWMMQFSNTDGMLEGEFSVLGGNGNNATSPGVTTSVDDSLILRLIGADDDDAPDDDEGGFPFPFIAGHLNITRDSSGNGEQSVSGTAVFRTQASSGPSNAGTFTNFPRDEQWRAVTLALRPKLSTPPSSVPGLYNGATCNDYSNAFGATTLTHTNGIPAASANSNRMVLVAWSGEGNPNPVSVTFDNAAMTRVGRAYLNDGNNDSTTELYAILDADLPAAAGTNYVVRVNGLPAQFGLCVVTLENVEQIIPAGNGAGMPVNIFTQDNPPTANVSTSITTPSNNSMVVSLTGNGLNGSYNLDSQLTELYDVSYQGQGGVFAFGADIVSGAGALTITNTASVTPNRVSQVVAAFAPASVATGADHYVISHSGSGGVCSASTITISAVDSLGQVDTAYTGTVTISSSSAGAGSWTLVDGDSPLIDLGSGSVEYEFVAGDNGVVVLDFSQSAIGTVNFDVVDKFDVNFKESVSDDPDLTVGNCEFRIVHSGTGGTCAPEAVSIGIYAGSDLLTDYTGTISLSTSTGNGRWSVPATGDVPQGILNEPGGNDGVATYTFVAGDGGIVDLSFASTVAGAVNINVTGDGYSVAPAYDADLIISLCALRISHSGTGDICSLEPVTITVVDGSGAALTDYSGTISLSTSSSNGSWYLNTGTGNFSDPVAHDGAASYTFGAGDNGSVVLDFNDRVMETVNFNVTDGDIYEDSGFDQSLSVGSCSFRISALSTEFGACSIEAVTIGAYDRAGNLATNYLGTVSITTTTNNGNWISTTGGGTLTDVNPNDGVAEYTFVAGDNGSVELSFNDQTVEKVNIDLDDNGMREDAGYDPDFEIIQCVPEVSGQCFSQGGLGGASITLDSSLDAISSRMVLMYINDEATVDTSSAQLTGPGPTNYPLTFIRREKNTAGAGNTLEVWGILDEDLPVDGGTYTASFTGPSMTDAAMCLVSAVGVKQTFPAENLIAPNNGQINSSQATNTRNAVTSINARANNSVIISAVSTGQNGSNYSSSLSDSLWAGGAANPNSAAFYGNSEIQAFAGPVTVTETNSQFNPNLHTHMVLALAPNITGSPLVTGYVPVELFQTFAGNMNYRATGNSLRTMDNPQSCNMVAAGTGSTAAVNIPPGSAIKFAYLYWAGSGSDNDNPALTDVDDEVFFGPDGGQIAITADDYFLIENPNGLGAGLDFFFSYKDVTGLISTAPSTTYRLSNLVVQTGFPWGNNQTCLGGWALVVVYDNALENLNVINLFHGFQPFQHSAFTLVPRNFRMASPDALTNIPNGQISHVTFEGDNTLNTGDEGFRLQNDPDNLTFDLLQNPFNIGAAQYNNTVSYPNYDANLDFAGSYTGNTTSYGTDVDTFYIFGANPGDLLYPFATVEAEEITTRYSAGQDLVMLGGEFVAVTNAPIADLEVFISSSGVFKVNSVGAGTFYYDVTNNGNGSVTNGFADGDVILTGNLPVGMTINSISALGWDCSSIVPTTTAFTCVYEIATTWSGGTTSGELSGGESLPTIEVSVNVAGESSYPLISSDITQSARISHVGEITSCAVMEPAGIQPDPTLCDRSPQFDNVNDLDSNTIDIDDLYEKDPTNNNVVSLLTTVFGIETDLQITKSVTGVLEEGQPGQYLLAVRNFGPDDTTKPITVTDTLPAGLVPNTATGSGWSCGISGQEVTCTMPASLAVGTSSAIVIGTNNISAPALEDVNVSNTAVVSTGQYNFDLNPANNADTEITKIVGKPVAGQERYLISVNTDSTSLGGLSGFGDGDLVLYSPASDTATLFMDESALGTTSINNLNAVHLLPNGQILLSSDTDGSAIVGQNFDAGDVVLYDPILGTATIIFDGSTVFALGQGDVDAVFVEYNNSYNPNDWDLVLSTSDTVTVGGVVYQDNDLFKYDISAGTSVILLDGFDGGVAANDVFNSNAEGDIDAVYIRYDDASSFVLSTDDATTTIAPNGSNPETFNGDSLVDFDSSNIEAHSVFDGQTPLGVFGPADGNRRLNAVHVVEDGYYGHFGIFHSGVGDTCSATTVTISKHAGLTHNIDTGYVGSILISNNLNDGTWAKDATANGVLTDLGNGQARYTYTPADNGEVILFLTQTTATSPIMNVNVTNGVVSENQSEDNGIAVSDHVTMAIYLDEFSNISYNNDDGIVSFADSWTEVNDDGSPSSGGIRISGGKLLLTNPGGSAYPEISRTIDFSGYTPNTVTDPLTLSFSWGRGNGTVSDTFVVEARSQDSDAWTLLQTYVAASGGVNESQVSIDLTAAGISPSSTTQIRFRVNAGYQIETVTLDNVQVVTATNDCNVTASVDHYAISHSGFGISCLAENVTITPHTGGDLITDPGAGVTITLSTVSNKGTWSAPLNGNGAFSSVPGTGQATYTYQAGETAITFPFNYTDLNSDPEVVTFLVQDNHVPFNSQVENSDLTVARAGLRFYNETDGNETYPTLVAGMDSFLYTGDILTVQALQVSDSNPTVCEDIFSVGSDITLQMAFECVDPDQCSTGPIPVDVTNDGNVSSISPVSSNGTNGVNVGGFEDMTLHFESFGSYVGARIDLNYADAGALQIHGRYNIPFLDGAGANSGNYMVGSGSNNFVVRPFGYDIDFSLNRQANGHNNSADSWAELATDSVFFIAGTGFDTTVRAVVWQAVDDDGLVNGVSTGVANDGIPDSGSALFDNAATPNYGNEADPVQNDLTLTHALVAPVGGVLGSLTDTTFTGFAASNGAETHSVTYDEVGIIDLIATSDDVGGYLGSGEGIVGDVLNIGRFIPADFKVDNTSIVGRPLLTPSVSSFTYMGEEFSAEFQLTARNSTGGITQNYFGDFAKLNSPSQFGFFAVDDIAGGDDDISYSSRLSESVLNGFPADFSADWTAGMVTLNGNLVLSKQASGIEEAPIETLQIALTVLDTDAVIDADRNVDDDDGTNEDVNFIYNLIGTQEFRYGRMLLGNAYGSEIPEEDASGLVGDDLGINIVVEYFDGTRFVVNGDDDATPYNSSDLSFITGSYTDNLNSTNMNVGTNVAAGNGVVLQGRTDGIVATDNPLYLQAPGINNDGSVVVELDLQASGLSFLQYDWRSEDLNEIEDETPNGNYINNPRALIEFGQYQGHERVINWQELFVD